ncbi:MAG: flavodoxin [Lachnospiraceae bacterium]|nr:flavodoxin [Lachnospiraceae bacterium]
MTKRVFSIILAGAIGLSSAAYGTNVFADQNSSDKTLIVYFSPSNSDMVDSVSGATPRVGDVSAVEYVAQMIEDTVDADVAKIIPETAYSVIYDDTADRAKSERDNNERPGFSLDVNPEDYDTIMIGYPIWWYGLPMVMETFFDTYDFSGKTIIPFNTHIGSRDSGTYADIAELEPDAAVLEGIAISANDVADAEKDVAEWLAKLGYESR